MESSSSSRMRTRSQCVSLAALPFFAIENILTKLGSSSALEVLKCKCVCKTLKEVAEYDNVYKHMELDTLSQDRFEHKSGPIFRRCRASGNPNMMFMDGMTYYFILGNVATGRQKLEDAANLGQVDARFVLGMLLMAQGPHRKEEALALLNSIKEFRHSWRTRTVQQTLVRVRHAMFYMQIPAPETHDCGLTCSTHRYIDRDLLKRAFMAGYRWIFECQVCLWDHCYAQFAFQCAADWLYD